jgi:nitroimidazol reductase NimA-like FMN-containing flavoprotein (pyridoxamine 5'-phosphate oxidase superfamily)
MHDPMSELQPQYSSENVTPPAWAEARVRLEQAAVYWLTTVRPDGRPHVTPLVAVWLQEALYFTTGPDERKARNLALNPHCVITTGCNTLQGLDLVVEGDARQVSDEATLQRVAEQYASKYDPPFHFTVRDGAFVNNEGGMALVYKVAPATVFGFGKGELFSQTRWRFG